MSDVNKNLGHATAYGYAKSKGYTGTEDDFATLMASYADVAEQARESAEDSEAWAVGERDGVPVPDTDAQYHNNSKYYAEQASTSAGESSDSAEASGSSALVSEGHATGSQNGEPVEEGSPYYHNNALYYSQMSSQSADDADGYKRDAETAKTNAETAETNAETAEGNAEAWAVGTKDSVPVTQSDPQYQNNAKYYAEQAQNAADASAAMTGLADQFDSTTTYAIGDYVLYDGTLYQFTASHPAGAWTGTDAVQSVLSGGVSDLKSQISANQIVCNASGAIASFVDGADGVPVRDLTVAIEPVQDLHGQDAPYPAGGGVNKIDQLVTIEGSAENQYSIQVESRSGGINSFALVAGVTYTLSCDVQCSVNPFSVSVGSGDGRYLKDVINVGGKNSGHVSVTFTPTEEQLSSGNIFACRPIRFGSPSSFTYSVTNLQLEIGSTATAYAPYSNICPISGWDEGTVWGTGVNVWDEEWEVGILDGNGEPSVATDRIRSKNFCSCVPNTEYRFVIPNQNMRIYFYDADKTFLEIFGYWDTTRTFTTPAKACFFKILGSAAYGTTYKNDIGIIYPSSNQDYAPYHGASYHSDFPSTVYGGDWAVTEGEIVDKYKVVDLGTLTWSYRSSNNRSIFESNIADMIPVPSSDTVFSGLCPIYKSVTVSETWTDNVMSWGASTSGTRTLAIVNNAYTSAASFKAAMSGVPLVYELDTPTTLTTDPHTIPSLLGDNNVWADCGDVSVDYVADPKLYIEQLTEPDADMIADSNITSGSYFMVGNQLFLATSNIASGGAITTGVNCTRTNLAEALNALNA